MQFIFNSPLEIPHAISLIPTPEIPYLQIPLSLFHNFSFFYFIPTGNSRQNRAPLLHPWKFHKFLLDPLEIPRSKSKTLEIQYFFFLEHPLKFHSALRVKLTPRNSICSFFDTYPWNSISSALPPSTCFFFSWNTPILFKQHIANKIYWWKTYQNKTVLLQIFFLLFQTLLSK